MFAFMIRFNGLNFGLPYLYLPDELNVMNSVMHMLATGDLNPHRFTHPNSFVMYLLAILYAIILAVYLIYCFLLGYTHNLIDLKQLVRNNPIFFYFIGRLLMVFFAVITIYLVYLIAKKLFNRSVGILASFCLAIAPLHIKHARFIRPDITTTMLVMFSIYFLLEYFEQNKNTKLLVLSSLFAGFSIATKYVSGIIIFPILIYCLIKDAKEKNLLTVKYVTDSFKIKTSLSRALLFIFLGFFIFAPFVILDFHHSIRDMAHMARGKHLGHERLPGIQNHIWYLKNALQKGISGLFFEIFAGLGLCLILFKKSFKKYLFLSFPIIFYIIMVGFGKLRWDRWLIPILPFEAILFGVGFYFSYKYFIQRKPFQVFKPVIFLLFAIILVLASFPTIIKDVNQGIKLSKTDTRTIAKEWIEKNIPSGCKIAYECYAPHLHIKPNRNFVLMNRGWKKIASKPLSYYKNQSVDYIIITSSVKRKFYNEPDKYAKEIYRYEELKNKTELIKVFDYKENPGPKIWIYRLKKLRNRVK